MRYTLAKIEGGHLCYYVDRTIWSLDLDAAMLLKERREAEAHRDLLPDREHINGIMVLPVRLVADWSST